MSEATLSRLARHLDFTNYAQFQQSIQQYLRHRLTPRVKMSQTIARRSRGPLSLDQILRRDAEHLQASLGENSEEAFQEAVGHISRARKVYLAGLGISRSLVDFLEFRLRRCGISVVNVAGGGNTLLEQIVGITREDTLVAIGFFRTYPELICALDWSREQGAPSVVISESLVSPLGRRATVTLVTKRGPVGELNSLVLPMAVVNALVVGVALARKEETAANMERLEKLRSLYEHILAEEHTNNSAAGGGRPEIETR